jgi:hypothetical protein
MTSTLFFTVVKLGMTLTSSYRNRVAESWVSVVGPDYALQIVASQVRRVRFAILTGVAMTIVTLSIIWVALITADLGLLIVAVPAGPVGAAAVVIARDTSPRNLRAHIVDDLWASGVAVLGKPSLRSIPLFSVWASANRVTRDDLVKAAASATAEWTAQTPKAIPVWSASTAGRVATILMSVCFAATPFFALPPLTALLSADSALTLPISLMSFLYWFVIAGLVVTAYRDPHWPAPVRPALTPTLAALLILDGALLIFRAPIGTGWPLGAGILDVVVLAFLWLPSTNVRVRVERAAQVARRAQVTARFDSAAKG